MVTSIHMTSYRRTDADGYAVFGGYEDGSIAQYDLRTGNVVRDYKKGLEPVLAMDLKPSMDTLMFGGGDEHMTKLMIEDSKSVYEDSSLAFAETQTVTLAAPGTSSIKYRCDGRIIVSGHWDNTMRIFDQKKLKPLAVIGHHAGGVYSIAFGKGGASTVFASASKDKTIALWDLFSDSLNR